MLLFYVHLSFGTFSQRVIVIPTDLGIGAGSHWILDYPKPFWPIPVVGVQSFFVRHLDAT